MHNYIIKWINTYGFKHECSFEIGVKICSLTTMLHLLKIRGTARSFKNAMDDSIVRNWNVTKATCALSQVCTCCEYVSVLSRHVLPLKIGSLRASMEWTECVFRYIGLYTHVKKCSYNLSWSSYKINERNVLSLLCRIILLAELRYCVYETCIPSKNMTISTIHLACLCCSFVFGVAFIA